MKKIIGLLAFSFISQTAFAECEKLQKDSKEYFECLAKSQNKQAYVNAAYAGISGSLAGISIASERAFTAKHKLKVKAAETNLDQYKKTIDFLSLAPHERTQLVQFANEHDVTKKELAEFKGRLGMRAMRAVGVLGVLHAVYSGIKANQYFITGDSFEMAAQRFSVTPGSSGK